MPELVHIVGSRGNVARVSEGSLDIKTESQQLRNSQEHQRVFDPDLYQTSEEIRDLLKEVVRQLTFITGEENENR